MSHDSTAWWVLPEPEALQRLDVIQQLGLSEEDADRRRQVHGPNRLAEAPPRSPWRLFFGQFKSGLILVLLVAAGLAGAIGNAKDAVVILGVVVLNAIVGFWQEYRAEQSLAALKTMLPANTHVRRGGHKLEVAADDLVPGISSCWRPGTACRRTADWPRPSVLPSTNPP